MPNHTVRLSVQTKATNRRPVKMRFFEQQVHRRHDHHAHAIDVAVVERGDQLHHATAIVHLAEDLAHIGGVDGDIGNLDEQACHDMQNEVHEAPEYRETHCIAQECAQRFGRNVFKIRRQRDQDRACQHAEDGHVDCPDLRRQVVEKGLGHDQHGGWQETGEGLYQRRMRDVATTQQSNSGKRGHREQQQIAPGKREIGHLDTALGDGDVEGDQQAEANDRQL
jgi:hypothetical protein